MQQREASLPFGQQRPDAEADGSHTWPRMWPQKLLIKRAMTAAVSVADHQRLARAETRELELSLLSLQDVLLVGAFCAWRYPTLV
eukprot:SAG11_NODE_8335_length_1027_cov_1.051724_1_plen_84_part_10